MTYCSYIILGAIATTVDLYIDYGLPVGILDLQCNGNESTIWNCSYNTTDGQECYNDASVFCMCMFCPLYTAFFIRLESAL